MQLSSIYKTLCATFNNKREVWIFTIYFTLSIEHVIFMFKHCAYVDACMATNTVSGEGQVKGDMYMFVYIYIYIYIYEYS